MDVQNIWLKITARLSLYTTAMLLLASFFEFGTNQVRLNTEFLKEIQCLK